MNIGVIGGSGLYQLGESSGEFLELNTPYGKPSGKIYRQKMGSNVCLFLPRHGHGHGLLPSEINYRANIFALKSLEASVVFSVSAVGSMKEEIVPGDFVLPDQYIDLTRGTRARTYFGDGVVGHAPFADPTCKTLRHHLKEIAGSLKIKVHTGGTYVCIEGPQFSSKAESNLYRSWNNVSVIGMTALPEARLAREAGLCYQTVAMATDYDCWYEGHELVSAEAVLKVFGDNVNTARKLVSQTLAQSFPSCRTNCKNFMKHSVVTSKEHWPKERIAELDIILK